MTRHRFCRGFSKERARTRILNAEGARHLQLIANFHVDYSASRVFPPKKLRLPLFYLELLSISEARRGY